MTNLLTWPFWFTLNPGPLTPLAQKLFIGLTAVFILAAIIIFFIKRKSGIYRGLLKKLYTFCLSNFFISLLFHFFNYELVPFFSARFWLALWGITMLIWLFFILKKLKSIPLQKKEQDKNKELKKYLP